MAVMALGMSGPAMALDKVTFGTNWKAQAEHGGYYQALVDGTYEKYGLDVTIRPGGPQVNHIQLLAAGKIDFNMGGNLFEQFNFTENNVPMVTVAAIFQKEPQVLIAHPDAGVKELADLDDKTIFISNDGRQSYWLWLKQVYGFTDDQLKPYTFNPAPFLADPNSVQQGYVTSEPYAIKQQGGFKPVVLMMADLATTPTRPRSRPRRSWSTKIRIWCSASSTRHRRLVQLPLRRQHQANALIKKDNPEITDEQIAFSISAMKEYGIVDFGDALTLGIGAMTGARIESFFTNLIWGVYPGACPIRPVT